ncbi:uncharacterized protein Tco025E_10076, partial [Trypanosoma conorhini]
MAGRALLVCALCALCCAAGGGRASEVDYCTESDWRDLRAVATDMTDAEIRAKYCGRKPEFVRGLWASLQDDERKDVPTRLGTHTASGVVSGVQSQEDNQPAGPLGEKQSTEEGKGTVSGGRGSSTDQPEQKETIDAPSRPAPPAGGLSALPQEEGSPLQGQPPTLITVGIGPTEQKAESVPGPLETEDAEEEVDGDSEEEDEEAGRSGGSSPAPPPGRGGGGGGGSGGGAWERNSSLSGTQPPNSKIQVGGGAVTTTVAEKHGPSPSPPVKEETAEGTELSPKGPQGASPPPPYGTITTPAGGNEQTTSVPSPAGDGVDAVGSPSGERTAGDADNTPSRVSTE